jgi:aspartate ammonia-lyase
MAIQQRTSEETLTAVNAGTSSEAPYRIESDSLGEMRIAADSLHGIETARALENFQLSGRRIHPAFIHAFGMVKLACALTNRSLGIWPDGRKADAIESACREMADGRLDQLIVVDSLQGGAGTSTNMNVNEVLANRALQLLNEPLGKYSYISPLDDINLHQSTNDTFPTALKLAAIWLLHELEERVVSLQEAFQVKEKQFAHVVKLGRTELQDAVLTTVGREMGAYAEAFSRDRWRIYKCEERLRVVNLGGTAIGTGIAAPRQFIFRVVEILRDLTGIGLARAENMVESTQNADVFVEVSGILKACAVSLLKICSDLRLLSSGPETGFGEIRLPARQMGSTIMPGKVNPVIPEAVSQIAMLVMGYDQTIALAAGLGNLELNAFLPLIADCLLESCSLLARGCDTLRRNCVEGIEVDEKRCRAHVENSTATATALVPVIGYAAAARLVKSAAETGKSIKETALAEGLITLEQFNEAISPEAVCRLGSIWQRKSADNG